MTGVYGLADGGRSLSVAHNAVWSHAGEPVPPISGRLSPVAKAGDMATRSRKTQKCRRLIRLPESQPLIP